MASRIIRPIDIHPLVLKKLHDDFENALKKLARQGTGSLIVFFSVRLDAETNERSAWPAIARRARQAASREGVRIVVINRFEWRDPVIDTLMSTVA